MKKNEFFEVYSTKYVKNTNYRIVRPASINNPKDNAVMFITNNFMSQRDVFEKVRECLIFWPCSEKVPQKINKKNAVCIVKNPHNEYCRFFEENNISYLPKIEEVESINGAFIAKSATIGKNNKIFPGAYIGGEVIIGDDVFIGSGVKLIGKVTVGNNVIIRENSVLGADGLSTDRNSLGEAMTMPQFGGIIIEDNVQIGALTVIARGAIDDTIIRKGTKIDNQCFISHNTEIGENSFIVGETIMFGSSSVGKRCLISGNCTIGNYVHIGDDSILGMNSMAINNIKEGVIAYGCPINTIKEK